MYSSSLLRIGSTSAASVTALDASAIVVDVVLVVVASSSLLAQSSLCFGAWCDEPPACVLAISLYKNSQACTAIVGSHRNDYLPT